MIETQSIARINGTWKRHIYIPYHYYEMRRSSLRERFGDRMRHLRLERRQTQEEFWIDLLKMSVDFGSMVERGNTAPSFETIETICSSLALTEAELFTFPPDSDAAVSRGRVKKTAEEKRRVRKRSKGL
jgi:transcriptional regulator with XRE-family HTH domain